MKVRLGSEQEHTEWDGREELRPILRFLLKNDLVGKPLLVRRVRMTSSTAYFGIMR